VCAFFLCLSFNSIWDWKLWWKKNKNKATSLAHPSTAVRLLFEANCGRRENDTFVDRFASEKLIQLHQYLCVSLFFCFFFFFSYLISHFSLLFLSPQFWNRHCNPSCPRTTRW
jgi:hypothetical protein